MTEMAKIMKMVVETFHLREDGTQISSAFRNRALARCFDCLAKGKRMGDAVYSGNPLCDQDAEQRGQPFESLLHAAMLEEKPRNTVENRFPNIAKKSQCHTDNAT